MTNRYLNAKELCSIPAVRHRVFLAIDKAYKYGKDPNELNLPEGASITTTMTSGFGFIPDLSLQAICLAPDRSLGYSQVLIAVRGTREMAQWNTNMQFVPAETHFGLRGHAGFLKMATSCFEELFFILGQREDLRITNDQFLFVGHSLGGALSHIFSVFMNERLSSLGSRSSQVVNITLGQPSVWHTTPIFPKRGRSHLRAEAMIGRDNIVRVIVDGNKNQDPITVLNQAGSGLVSVLSFVSGSVRNVGIFKHIGWEWKGRVATDKVICHDMAFYALIMLNDVVLQDSDFELSLHM